MDIQPPETSQESFPCQLVKTSHNTLQRLVSLGNLQPNTVVKQVLVSRNIPKARLLDGVTEYWLPGDNKAECFFLFSIDGTESDWVLTLVSKPDDNQPAAQTHTVPTYFNQQ